METTITVSDLATDLADVLDRVRDRGERFVVEREGRPVATISPARVPAGASLGEVLAEIGDRFPVGDGFADDLEAIQANQGRAEMPEWPD